MSLKAVYGRKNETKDECKSGKGEEREKERIKREGMKEGGNRKKEEGGRNKDKR